MAGWLRLASRFTDAKSRFLFCNLKAGNSRTSIFDFVCQPMFKPEGGLDGVFIHAVDLTDRVESRCALEASRERLSLAHEAAQMGTWEWDGVANKRVSVTGAASYVRHGCFDVGGNHSKHVDITPAPGRLAACESADGEFFADGHDGE